ncbi:PA14 domain-containing protein [Niallia nealsonii]|uniref:PA14 domain-containing protein n=1 Tax=Niallia nealsonii TaxID=115979 RepID=A0A2N0YXW4_9BACI|nr:PA14 domain-containing protein [Niallia nealsonii]PKG22098.1 hypothetical protein CWS01_19220 [Niallia nealsonii]
MYNKLIFFLGIVLFVFLLYIPFDKAEASSNWSGGYYNNKSLTGSSIEQKYDFLRLNWGTKAPIENIHFNRFSARFEKSLTVDENKDYFLHAYADDGLRMYADNSKAIDSWSTGGKFSSAVLPNLTKGNHSIRTDYYEDTGNASLFAEVLPFGEWIGYYYNNVSLKGAPEDSKIYPSSNDSLTFDYGYGRPSDKVKYNNYSAKFYTVKRMEEGDYLIKAKADDGIRVYIDGEKVVDEWKSGYNGNLAVKVPIKDTSSSTKDIHEIRVEYFEGTGKSALDFSIKPSNAELSTKDWYATYYNNTSIGGTFYENRVENIAFNWGIKAPIENIHFNRFSARFEKSLTVDENKDYFLHAYADDGLRMYADNSKAIDSWSTGGKFSSAVLPNLTKGNHSIRTDYYEDTGNASLFAEVLPFGEWIGYYYNNVSLKGAPEDSKIYPSSNDSLTFDYGYGRPSDKVKYNSYSAKFYTFKRMEEGDYLIKAKADDGIRVYIDGKKVVDEWKSGYNGNLALKVPIKDTSSSTKDIHEIRVEYFEGTGKSALDFSIKPVKEELSTTDWYATYYNNTSTSGTFYENRVGNIAFDWGKNAPLKNLAKDNFSASFYKLLPGDKKYFISTFADDGIRVRIDNKWLINRWSGSQGTYNTAIYDAKKNGNQIIKVDYFDKKSDAKVFADVAPLGDWLAYYYNNKNLEGTPAAVKTINTSNSMTLSQDFDANSPASGVNKGNFSAKYVTAKELDAGEYVIRGFSDDGIQVLIDGEIVINQWRDGAYKEKSTKVKIEDTDKGNIHWIEVRHYTNKANDKFKLSFIPAKDSNLVDSSGWYAEYYPKTMGKDENPIYKVKDAQKPVIVGGKDSLNTITDINFNWKTSSSDSNIPTDHFSAIFKREFVISENANYNFTVKADDGVILEIDGETVIDAWSGKINKGTKAVGYYLSKGKHQFVLRYKEGIGNASIKFSMEKAKAVFTSYENTNYRLNEAVNIQMTKSAQTDKKYTTYMSENAFRYISSKNDYGLIDNGTWNVRGGPSTSYWIVGKLKEGDKVTIKSKAKDSSGTLWYEVDYYKYWKELKKETADFPATYGLAYNTWVNAGPTDVKYYMDAANFISDENQKLQFLVLSSSANVSESEVNANILKGKGILSGKAQSFIQAGEKYGINEIYLISHALLETGNGTSTLATGIKVSAVDGKKVTPKTVYNMYGIGAYDAAPIKGGSEYAYKQGWDTPEKAIIGGAEFIGENYINHPTYNQDTLYKMRWNPLNPGVHQYATDIGWASKQVNKISSLYGMLSSYRMDIEIPTYK